MSLLSRALTVSQVVMNVSASVGFLFISYFWYQNARSVQESRMDRDLSRQQYKILMGNCRDVYQPSCCPCPVKDEEVTIGSEAVPVAETAPVSSECCSTTSCALSS